MGRIAVAAASLAAGAHALQHIRQVDNHFLAARCAECVAIRVYNNHIATVERWRCAHRAHLVTHKTTTAIAVLLIGWRRERGEVVINPSNKSEQLKWARGDELIVIRQLRERVG